MAMAVKSEGCGVKRAWVLGVSWMVGCGEVGWEHKDVKEENTILCANQQTDNGGEEQKKTPKEDPKRRPK